MTYKNTDFATWLKGIAQKPTIYMWGTFGNKVTESLINTKTKQYPTHYPAYRINTLRRYINSALGCDCCGLIKWYLMTDGGRLSTPVYSSKYDKNTSMWYNAATEKGKISTMPEIAGLAVYKNGHIGVYIGNGKVIECTLSSRGDGVVYSNLSAEKWTHWLKIPYIEYSTTISVKENVDKVAKEVLRGLWGNGAERKRRLTEAGYNYAEVQAKVNELLASVDIDKIAREVINGKWGVGADRKKRLTEAGYNYTEVQSKVNELLK